MSGNIRAGSVLWSATATVDSDTAPHATSAAGRIGPPTSVALLIKSNKVATFKIQVAGNVVPGVGRNVDFSALDWYDWHRSADADGVETITVAATGGIAVDLSPFAPEFIRLVATSVTSGPATVTAFCVANG